MSSGVDPQLEQARARVGESLRDKWTLERLLGVGGMAAVYSATHRNGFRGAVKLLHPELNAIREVKERFLREGYAANQVAHPGVVRVLDDDVAQDGSVFLVMELLEGQTIDALADARPGNRLSLDEVLAVADMVLDVLVVAHEKGIVHRDLKPQNLFLTTKGEVRVLDFGIARIRELQGSSRATQTGASMGTPAYMPPEQASGQWSLVDARTDLWAVGATMFALLTGRCVHEAPTLQLILAATMTQPAPPLAQIQAEVPPSVAAIVDRALAFDRDARWPDARTMQSAVRAMRSGGWGLSPQTPVSPFSFAPAPVESASTVALGAMADAPTQLLSTFEPTLVLGATDPTTAPVSSGATAATPAPNGSRALLAVAAVAIAAVVAGAGWFALHRSAPSVPASGAPTTSAEPSPVASESATVAPSVLPAPDAAPGDEAPRAGPPPARPRPAGTTGPAPTVRPKSTGAPQHPGIY